MPTNRQIPWPRIVAEGVAIVVSILLAFSIEAWWADRGDREEEKRLLVSLRDELVANDIVVENQMRFHRAMADSSMSLLRAYADQKKFSDDELDKALGSLAFANRALFQYGVVTGLVQSGKLSLIQDESLRNQIASILGEQARVTRSEASQNDTFTYSLMPFLRRHASVPQLSNAQPSSPGTDDYEQPPLPIRRSTSHQHIMESEEFVAIVTEVYWNQNDSITSLSKYQNFAEDLITRIDATLDTMNR